MRTTGKKDLRVKDIIEINCPGLYRKLSRGDKCRVGRAISTMINLGRLPHLSRGNKKGPQTHTIAKLTYTGCIS